MDSHTAAGFAQKKGGELLFPALGLPHTTSLHPAAFIIAFIITATLISIITLFGGQDE